jgi:WD40 repeat protein
MLDPGRESRRLYWSVVAQCRARPGDVSGVTFSPDGHTLATTSNNTAGLWDLRGILQLSGRLTSGSCAAAGGGLAQKQWNTFAPGIPYRPTC